MTDALEAALVGGVAAAVRTMSWRRSLRFGERLGATVQALGIRRRVAAANLERCVPGWPAAQRAEILRQHYRELGRIAVEYARLPELAMAPADDESVAIVRGLEPLRAALERGRGAVIVTGHFGNFELAALRVARHVPVTLVARPQSNADVDRWVMEQRRRSGVAVIPVTQPRAILGVLRRNAVVAMVGDQDAGRDGVFVPFLGRLASTARGPARIAAIAGAPLLTAFSRRGADERHVVTIEPPIEPEGDTIDGVTRRHVARLEEWVRRDPWNWLWLHRRWKTSPPAEADVAAASPGTAAVAGG